MEMKRGQRERVANKEKRKVIRTRPIGKSKGKTPTEGRKGKNTEKKNKRGFGKGGATGQEAKTGGTCVPPFGRWGWGKGKGVFKKLTGCQEICFGKVLVGGEI